MNGEFQISLPENNAVECFRQVPLSSHRQIWCFAHAGGGAAQFAKWPGLADPGVLICAVRLPGRERRLAEPPVTDLRDLVKSLAVELDPLIRPGAVFFGQCLGALVAFEVAAELQRIGGVLPECVFVASQVAPRHQRADTRISLYDDQEFRLAVRNLGGLPAQFLHDDKIWNFMEPVFRADFRLVESYSPAVGPIAVPITALVGADDSSINIDEVRDWRAYSTVGYDLKVVSGNHFLNLNPGNEVLTAIQRAQNT